MLDIQYLSSPISVMYDLLRALLASSSNHLALFKHEIGLGHHYRQLSSMD